LPAEAGADARAKNPKNNNLTAEVYDRGVLGMKIAMPTDDRKSLAGHFGRAAEFAIYEAAAREAEFVEYRPNVHVHHGGAPGPAAGHGADHTHDFEEGLAGVEVLICRGTAEEYLDDVAAKFARGELAEADPSCGCGHGPPA